MEHQHEREGVITLTKHNLIPVNSVIIPEEYQDKLDGIILTNGMIEDRTAKLAYDLSRDYAGKRLHLLCVLKGAHTFFSALTRHLQANQMLFTYDFVKVKSYDGDKSTGNVRVEGVNLESLKGRNVIVVEDIIDTGNTMKALIPMLEGCGVESVVTCVLCEKDTPLSCGYKSNYCGFIVPDMFIVGNGFDFDEAMREMPHTGVISKHGVEYYTEHKLLYSVYLQTL